MTVQLHKPKILYVYAAFLILNRKGGIYNFKYTSICIYYVKYIKLKLRGNMYVSMDFKKD